MPNVRQAMFPYGMEKNPDGSWTLFNRKYKRVGVMSREWAKWDDPRHKLQSKVLPPKLAKLDCKGERAGRRIYFYDDSGNPESSPLNFKLYMKKLKILISLQEVI